MVGTFITDATELALFKAAGETVYFDFLRRAHGIDTYRAERPLSVEQCVSVEKAVPVLSIINRRDVYVSVVNL